LGDSVALAAGTRNPITSSQCLVSRTTRNGILVCIETMLRSIYDSRGETEWKDLIEIMHRSNSIIERVAVVTIAWQLVGKGMAHEVHKVLQELLEERIGTLPSALAEKFLQIQDLEACKKPGYGEGAVRH